MTVEDAVEALAREPLRHFVLLKQLPAYPKPALAVFIASDHPDLTSLLMPHVPRGVGIVFKLDSEADVAPLQAHFPVARRTAFVSFASAGAIEPDAGVRVTMAPGDAAFRLFEGQDHDRAWLEAVLQSGKAFARLPEHYGMAVSACFAVENHGAVWEAGGVVTAAGHRRRGLAARVVRTALAELGKRGLAPRYQVEEHNTASIALARSVGLAPFATIAHYICDA